ncbi:MAG TPA: LysR substrate-binding domain-containing protein [Burkholderiaceae bacterium]|nr:LysR substrate-binding domain-containing protein [Burkholderiaceae bacterium]
MTLQELRYLVALADKGHFVRAAEACHVGQPTLSTQLKKLEEYLGVTLFERNKHHLQATPIGEQIIVQARIALGVVAQIRDLARRGLDPMNGPLRLGVIPTLGPYLIPHLLPEIRRRFPELHLFLREDLTGHLLERLRQGRLDALLLALPVRGDDVQTLPLFRESFVVALPSDHPLAARRRVTQEDLARENVLLLEEGHCMRDQALAICGAQSSDQREELKATSIETLRQMVAAGVGCTLLPRLASLPGTGSLRGETVLIRPFEEPLPTRTIGLAWRRNFPRESTIRTVAAWISAQLPPEVEKIGAVGSDPGATGASSSGAARPTEALSAQSL